MRVELSKVGDGICFFFKQKTAYEMRISDWSSDVCSSDLPCRPPFARRRREFDRSPANPHQPEGQEYRRPERTGPQLPVPHEGGGGMDVHGPGADVDPARVGAYHRAVPGGCADARPEDPVSTLQRPAPEGLKQATWDI